MKSQFFNGFGKIPGQLLTGRMKMAVGRGSIAGGRFGNW